MILLWISDCILQPFFAFCYLLFHDKQFVSYIWTCFCVLWLCFHFISNSLLYFLSFVWQDIDGVILCIFASSDVTDCGDATTIFQTVRQTIGWNSEIVVSIVHESSLEPNVILTTVIAFGWDSMSTNSTNLWTPDTREVLFALYAHVVGGC